MEEYVSKPTIEELKPAVDAMFRSFAKILHYNGTSRLQGLGIELLFILQNDRGTVKASKEIRDIVHLLTDPQMIDETMLEISCLSQQDVGLQANLKSTAYRLFRELKNIEDEAHMPRIKHLRSKSKFARTPNYEEELAELKNFLIGKKGVFRQLNELADALCNKYNHWTPASLSQVLNFNDRYTMSPELARAIYFLLEEDTSNGEQSSYIFCKHIIKTYGDDALKKMDQARRLQ